MSQIVVALDAGGSLSAQQTALLATAECLRARIELHAGHLGAARLSAATAVALAGSSNSNETIRTNVRVLVSAARIAHDVGDIQTARGRASQALTTAQVTLGPSDRDTAYAWHVLEQACEAAGDSVAARAGRRQRGLRGQSSWDQDVVVGLAHQSDDSGDSWTADASLEGGVAEAEDSAVISHE
jgi:hypothetical protein